MLGHPLGRILGTDRHLGHMLLVRDNQCFTAIPVVVPRDKKSGTRCSIQKSRTAVCGRGSEHTAGKKEKTDGFVGISWRHGKVAPSG